jgi:hypothetical protein
MLYGLVDIGGVAFVNFADRLKFETIMDGLHWRHLLLKLPAIATGNVT